MDPWVSCAFTLWPLLWNVDPPFIACPWVAVIVSRPALYYLLDLFTITSLFGRWLHFFCCNSAQGCVQLHSGHFVSDSEPLLRVKACLRPTRQYKSPGLHRGPRIHADFFPSSNAIPLPRLPKAALFQAIQNVSRCRTSCSLLYTNTSGPSRIPCPSTPHTLERESLTIPNIKSESGEAGCLYTEAAVVLSEWSPVTLFSPRAPRSDLNDLLLESPESLWIEDQLSD